MKLDLKKLCRSFTKAPEEASVSTDGVNPYLLNHVLLPTLNGDPVSIQNIDCEQYDHEDVRWLAGYYESLDMQAEKLAQFVGPVSTIEPLASARRQFC